MAIIRVRQLGGDVMEPVMAPVGVRDAKNRFSELTLAVNETGKQQAVGDHSAGRFCVGAAKRAA